MALLILGMHRGGTSCVAAMLGALGAKVPGIALRNWDNPRGHHEAAELVRLNDEVLAHSGGHWLAPPAELRWTPAHAAERDRLLAQPGALLKDPRSALALPFWQASSLPFGAIAVVRHPLASARSLRAWRGHPLDEGLRLWRAHMAPLLAAGLPTVHFDAPKAELVARLLALAPGLGLVPDAAAMEGAYAAELVHHGAGAGPAADPALLAQCLELHRALGGRESTTEVDFPWREVDGALEALGAGDGERAQALARAALASGADPAGVLGPLAPAFLKARQGEALLGLLEGLALPAALDGLLRGKAHLAAGRPAQAARCLEAACAAPEPLHEARHLLPTALWEAGEPEAADGAMAALLATALYPFRVHARRAEWSWILGDSASAFAHLEAALQAAPLRRHGRLLHRRAAWRERLGDPAGAAADRALARERDPAYPGQSQSR